jgi:hypothetical protein
MDRRGFLGVILAAAAAPAIVRADSLMRIIPMETKLIIEWDLGASLGMTAWTLSRDGGKTWAQFSPEPDGRILITQHEILRSPRFGMAPR